MAKRVNVKGLQPAAEILAGLLVARTVSSQVLNKVEAIRMNPLIGTGVKAALGLFLTGQRSKTMKNLGTGMVVDGLGDVYDHFMPAGSAAGLPTVQGIAGRSRIIPGDRGLASNRIAGVPQYANPSMLVD